MWLTHFERVNGRLYGMTSSSDGVCVPVSVDKLHTIALPVHRNKSLTFTTRLDEWTLESADRYLAGAKLPPDIAGKHDVFKVHYDGHTILIPALSMLKALFYPGKTLFRYVFSPVGLDQLCSPVEENGELSVSIGDRKLSKSLGNERIVRLRWMYFFPSAKATWGSVYAAAMRGKCGLSLPRANVKITIHGQRHRGFILAGNVTLGNIEVREDPYEWAGCQPRYLTQTRVRALSVGERAIAKELRLAYDDSDFADWVI